MTRQQLEHLQAEAQRLGLDPEEALIVRLKAERALDELRRTANEPLTSEQLPAEWFETTSRPTWDERLDVALTRAWNWMRHHPALTAGLVLNLLAVVALLAMCWPLAWHVVTGRLP